MPDNPIYNREYEDEECYQDCKVKIKKEEGNEQISGGRGTNNYRGKHKNKNNNNRGGSGADGNKGKPKYVAKS